MARSYSSISGNQFAQLDPFVAVTVNPNQTDGKLLLIHNTRTDVENYHIKARIPIGFEPQSRNNLPALIAYKDGFLFSFLGDRTIHQINTEGVIVKSVSFGVDDELPEPFQSETQNFNSGAQPYISKIQVSDTGVYFILDGKINKVNWDTNTPLYSLKFSASDSVLTNPIVDFATSEDVIYIRYGRNEVYVGKVKS